MTGRSATPTPQPSPHSVTTSRPWRRPSAWLAVAVLAVSLGMVAFSVVSLVAPGSEGLPSRPNLVNILAAMSVFVALPSVGAILAILRPHNPIGWLFLVGGAGVILGSFSTEYVGRAVRLGTSLPGVVLVDWLSAWVPNLSLLLTVIWVPLLFPDGRLPSRRWRPFAWFAGVTVAVSVGASAVATGPTYSGMLANPIGVGGRAGDAVSLVASSAVFPLIALLAIISLASLVVRFRRARDVERQQMKWFLLAVCFLVVAIVIAFATQLEGAWYALLVGLALLPISAGIAVLRYRLYDIDRIISRTVSYAIITGVLALVFVAAVIVFQAVLAPVLGKNPVAVAASTLVVATLFQPLRGRVQRVVDRRFDRSRYDAERTVAAFAARLRDDVDLDNLEAEVRTVVDHTVAPSTVGLWMRRPELES